jgi:hypothetical protein
MNMKNNPTERQLHDLLFACNDEAGDHVLWVNRLGDVQITLLTQETTASWAARLEDQIQYRYKAYEAGNDLVGQNAAGDSIYVSRLFDELLMDWQKDQHGYIDT